MRQRSRLAAILLLILGSTLAAIPVAEAGGGCHATRFTDEATTSVAATANCFVPTVARVPVGGTVVWTSDDAYDHAVTAVADSFRPDGDVLNSRNDVNATFDRPGVYPYVCPLHPTMAGAVVVGDGGTNAVAAATVSDDTGVATAAAGLGIAGFAVLVIVALPRLARRRR